MQKGDNEQIKSKKEIALNRFKSKYPDSNFEDEEVLFGQINDDYDDYDKRIGEMQEREQSFANLFTQDPRSASFFMSWRNGDDPAMALIKMYGTDIVDIINDPERQEEVAEANKEYLDRVAEDTKYEEEYKANLAESMALLEKMQQEKGYSDDEANELIQYLVGIYTDVAMGKFTPDALELARKALHHDEDVAVASHEGEVRGRNEKIEEKLRTRNSGDGLAALDGKNGVRPTQPRKAESIFDLAKQA